MRRLAGLLAAVAAVVLLPAAPASAHPLGNFTVNTADRVVVDADGVAVTHLVDLAEIPTVQLAGVWDADDDGRLAAPELAAYAADSCGAALPLLALEVDGAPADLRLTGSSAEQLPGQAGLPTTRVECSLRADADVQEQVAFRDAASAGRTGWREVTATTRCGRVTSSDVPADSPSALLTRYPEDLLASPVDVRTAVFSVDPGPCAGADGTALAERTALPRGLGGLASTVTDFLGRPDLTVPFALLSAAAALAFGAVHALAPGHGKTVLAAYLVGQRGTRRQALQLGAVVTFTHTASVLLLGAVLALGALASPERVVPLTEVVSGVLLAGVGAYLLVLALRRRRADHGHAHDHGDHDHGDHDHAHPDGDHGHGHGGHDHGGPHADHGHDHDHPHGEHDHDHHGHGGHGDHGDHGDHGHPHPAPVLVPAGPPAQRSSAPDGRHAVPHHHEQRTGAGGSGSAPPGPLSAGSVALAPPPVHSHGGRAHSHALPQGPLTWRSLAAMGVAGGLVPSPSALVVLLGATYLGRAWFGVVLVLLYGLGMAATLTVAGLLLLRTQAALDRRGWAFGRGTRLGRLLPLVTAGVVVLVGGGLVVRGLLASSALG